MPSWRKGNVDLQWKGVGMIIMNNNGANELYSIV